MNRETCKKFRIGCLQLDRDRRRLDLPSWRRFEFELAVDRAGRCVFSERVWLASDGWKRLGVDHRLVPGPRQDREALLHDRQSAR